MRDEIIEAISAWGGSLEAPIAEQNTLPDTGPAVQQVILGLCDVAAAVVLSLVDARPEAVGSPVWAGSAVTALFETLTEEGLAEGAAKGVADRKAEYYRNLVSNPEVTATAKKYGLASDSFARTMADDYVEQMAQAIRSTAPLVLRVAQEPWSVTALEERLVSATATPDGPAAEWYADPLGRHQYRYWDGASWTSHVADGGQQSYDPLPPGA